MISLAAAGVCWLLVMAVVAGATPPWYRPPQPLPRERRGPLIICPPGPSLTRPPYPDPYEPSGPLSGPSGAPRSPYGYPSDPFGPPGGFPSHGHLPSFPAASPAQQQVLDSPGGARVQRVPANLDLPLMKQVVQNSAENQAISPFVMSSLMTQVWLGARGDTKDQVNTSELPTCSNGHQTESVVHTPVR